MSAIPELQTFASGSSEIRRLFKAGLTLPYSNGPLEGNVNRLKLIKGACMDELKL